MIFTNKRSFASNLTAGIASAGWSGLAALIIVPFYVKILGVSNYGLITFFATMQGMFVVFDLGLSSAINREVARALALDSQDNTRDLFHTLSALYWLIGVLIGVSVYLTAPYIGQYWLRSQILDQHAIVSAVRLMGLVFIFRWPVGLYVGVLQGAHRIVSASAITMIATTFSTFGTILVFQLFSSTMNTFFIWQALVALCQVLFMRDKARQVFGRSTGAVISLDSVRPIWYFSGLIAITTVMGATLLQADKIVLSARASLEEVATYGLAGLAARSLLLLVAPIYSAIYPRMSAMVAADRLEDLTALYHSGGKLLSIVLCALGAFICSLSYQLFILWTGSESIAQNVHWIVVALVIGTVLNGIMYFPHAVQLAYGNAKLPLQINILLTVFLLPALFVLVPPYGALGAAAAWLGMNIVNYAAGIWLTHRSLLRGRGAKWLFRDTLLPGLLTAALVISIVSIIPAGPSSLERILTALPAIPLSVLVVAALSSDTRRLIDIRHFINRRAASS